MTRPSVYLETTIISYLAARPSRDLITAAHQQITHDWWNTRARGFDLYVSQFVHTEAMRGDPDAARRRVEVLTDIPILQATSDAYNLAEHLFREGAVPSNVPEDAAHIAVAAINGMTYLLTWNCRHIANAEVRPVVSEVCKVYKVEPPIICTREELMEAKHVGRPDRR